MQRALCAIALLVGTAAAQVQPIYPSESNTPPDIGGPKDRAPMTQREKVLFCKVIDQIPPLAAKYEEEQGQSGYSQVLKFSKGNLDTTKWFMRLGTEDFPDEPGEGVTGAVTLADCVNPDGTGAVYSIPSQKPNPDFPTSGPEFLPLRPNWILIARDHLETDGLFSLTDCSSRFVSIQITLQEHWRSYQQEIKSTQPCAVYRNYIDLALYQITIMEHVIEHGLPATDCYEACQLNSQQTRYIQAIIEGYRRQLRRACELLKKECAPPYPDGCDC